MFHSKAVLILFVLFAHWLVAQEDTCSRPIAPGDVQLVLSVSDGRKSFQQGEIIPVDLSFTANRETAYRAESRPEGRNVRLPYEQYCVQPASPDPLKTYYNGSGVALDGPAYDHALGAKPFVAHVELNEFLTLLPGSYEICAVSFRVFRGGSGGSGFIKHFDVVPVRSNTIRIEVVQASPEWARAQIKAADENMASAERNLDSSSSWKDAYQAARTLRFLISEDAARALVRIYSGKENYDQPGARELELGLFGSPYRQLVLSEMHEQVTAPERAVTEGFLETLSRLQITADPEWTAPPESDNSSASQGLRRRYADHRIAVLNAEARRLAETLSNKTGAARAFSAEALIRCCADDAELAIPARRALIESWKNLPDVEQQRLITSDWPVIGGPEMIPILKSTLSGPIPEEGRLDSMAHHDALKDLFDLDPAQARPFIDRDLRKSGTKPAVELLELLSGSELSAAVQPSIDRISNGDGDKDDFARVDRFASKEVLPQISAVFERSINVKRCEGQESMIRYFIRVDPNYATGRIDDLLRRESTEDCVANVFLGLEEQLPLVQSAALRALDHPNPWVVRDAANALGRYGTSEVEGALWARLEQQHKLLAAGASKSKQNQAAANDQIYVSQDLVTALATGVAWLCRPEKLTRLKELTDTDSERQDIEMWTNAWKDDPLTVTPMWHDEGSLEFIFVPVFNLTEAQLKTRFAQFPRGTRVVWQIWNPHFVRQSVQRAEFEKFQSWSKPLGVTIDAEVLP
jgi:hypothetical protein